MTTKNDFKGNIYSSSNKVYFIDFRSFPGWYMVDIEEISQNRKPEEVIKEVYRYRQHSSFIISFIKYLHTSLYKKSCT